MGLDDSSDSAVGMGGQPPPGGGEDADAAARFRTAWVGLHHGVDADPLLLPDRLAAACVTVLPVDGAGLSLVEADLRVPLGASDPLAALAEQFQFTQGEGPCLDAGRDRQVVTVGQPEMSRRWPQFAHELLTRTQFRAVISVPLAVERSAGCVLDMFVIDERGLRDIGLSEVTTIAAAVQAALMREVNPDGSARNGPVDDGVKAWLGTPAAHNRRLVWVAMGMMRGRFRLTAADAIAALRAYAYGHDTTVDTVAAELVNGILDLDDLGDPRT